MFVVSLALSPWALKVRASCSFKWVEFQTGPELPEVYTFYLEEDNLFCFFFCLFCTMLLVIRHTCSTRCIQVKTAVIVEKFKKHESEAERRFKWLLLGFSCTTVTTVYRKWSRKRGNIQWAAVLWVKIKMKERETVVAALRDQKCFHLWAGKMVQKRRKEKKSAEVGVTEWFCDLHHFP